MKISQLALKSGISKDTIHYYTKLGLLLPRREGSNHRFTQREVEDLEYIQRLKVMQFSLKQIQAIVQLRRLSNWNEPETRKEYLELLREKNNQINSTMTELQKANQLIQQEISAVKQSETPEVHLGVPVDALQYLACPHCGGALHMTGAEFSYPYFFEGKLCCGCGYHLEIVDGILDTGNRYTGQHDSPDLNRSLYKGLPDEFYKYFHIGADQCVNQMNQMDLTGRVVIETHINGYFFLYNHFQSLKNNCIYIITDKYIETLKMYKQRIELLGLNLNILFLADATMDYPLKEHCINVLVSFFTDGEHQLYFESPLAADVQRYLAPDAEILGTSILFGKNSQSFAALKRKYPEGGCGAFQEEQTKQYYSKLGYQLNWKALGTLYQTPNQFSFACHKDGESLSLAYYHAKKRLVEK